MTLALIIAIDAACLVLAGYAIGRRAGVRSVRRDHGGLSRIVKEPLPVARSLRVATEWRRQNNR